MLKIFDSILEQTEKQWKETDMTKEHEQQLMKKLESLNAYTPEVEISISNYGMQLFDDGITIGFITALQMFQELSEFAKKYRREDYGKTDS